MGKFYTVNEEFEKYLKELGFTFHDREEENTKYFTEEKTGKQVKIDNQVNLITLLDNQGYLVDESSSFTDNQILKFIQS